MNTNTAQALLDNRSMKSVADAALIAMTVAKDSSTLLAAHAALDAKGYDLTAEERLVLATIADVLTARHDLGEALDAIFDCDETFDVSYHDALLIAMAAAGAGA